MLRLQEVHTVELPGITTAYSGCRRTKAANPNTVVSQLATDSHCILVEYKRNRWSEYLTYAHRLTTVCKKTCSNYSNGMELSCVAHDALERANVNYQVFSLQNVEHGSSEKDDPQEDMAVKTKLSTPSSLPVSASTPNITNSTNNATSNTTKVDLAVKGTFLLIRKQPTTLLSQHAESKQHLHTSKLQQDQLLPIDYQPLPLHIAELFYANGHSIVALLVGCFTEPYLRIYVENNTDRFEVVDFSFVNLSSPTMSLSTLYDAKENLNYLAIGAQNGTVTIVVFRINHLPAGPFSPHVVFTDTFHVDGPLLTMQFHLDMSPSCFLGYYWIDLVIGSLRGFVCMYRRTIRNNETSNEEHIIQKNRFQGNNISIVDGLYSDQLKIEDSVLTVHKFRFATKSGSLVAVGTYAGQLLLFDAPNEHAIKSTTGADVKDVPLLSRYKLVYSRNFYSPIHGIAIGDLDGDGLPELLITSLKRIHIFRFDLSDLACLVHDKLQYIIAMRKEENEILKGRKHE